MPLISCVLCGTMIATDALSRHVADRRSAFQRVSHHASAKLAVGTVSSAARNQHWTIKLRTAQIALDQRAAALAMFNNLVVESFTVLPVTGAHFRSAAKFVDQYALGLRTGDALHLATASEHGATVHTLDRRLAEAGPLLGVPAHLLIRRRPVADDWTDEQNDAIVADYFAMLADDIARQSYSKAEHNRVLQVVISRPRGSIEYKHQNISAVLKGLGEDWIFGYKKSS
jgi:predicted nucleic acid-binding protein